MIIMGIVTGSGMIVPEDTSNRDTYLLNYTAVALSEAGKVLPNEGTVPFDIGSLHYLKGWVNDVVHMQADPYRYPDFFFSKKGDGALWINTWGKIASERGLEYRERYGDFYTEVSKEPEDIKKAAVNLANLLNNLFMLEKSMTGKTKKSHLCLEENR